VHAAVFSDNDFFESFHFQGLFCHACALEIELQKDEKVVT